MLQYPALIEMQKTTNRLENRVALITGSSSGLGRSIAFAFAREGALVCCVDLYPTSRNPINAATGKADDLHNRLTELEGGQSPTHEALPKHASGNAHIFVTCDVTAASEVEAAVQRCVDAFGRLDIMVNNAGISVESTHQRVLKIHEYPEEDYDKTMAINSKGVWLGCKYAIAQMLRQGSTASFSAASEQSDSDQSKGWIINISSVQAYVGYYGTCKFSEMNTGEETNPPHSPLETNIC
jgi:NAD(P)-dependent dehydrogenase (short-subunit alcohol dehydrogenase family)